jgi:hypothetical protein
LQRLGFGKDLERPEPLTTQEANARIKRLVEAIPNTHWIDLSSEVQSFAADGTYLGRPVYMDSNHLNVYGASALANLMIARGQRLLPGDSSGAPRIAEKVD